MISEHVQISKPDSLTRNLCPIYSSTLHAGTAVQDSPPTLFACRRFDFFGMPPKKRVSGRHPKGSRTAASGKPQPSGWPKWNKKLEEKHAARVQVPSMSVLRSDVRQVGTFGSKPVESILFSLQTVPHCALCFFPFKALHRLLRKSVNSAFRGVPGPPAFRDTTPHF